MIRCFFVDYLRCCGVLLAMMMCVPNCLNAQATDLTTTDQTATGIQPVVYPGISDVHTLDQWLELRPKILQLWTSQLGHPTAGDYPVGHVERVDSFQTPDFRAEVLIQTTGPATRQKMVLLKPLEIDMRRNRKTGLKRVPAIVVPYYDPDRMCGCDLATRQSLPERLKNSCFGLQLVRQGYIVLCVEAYPFNLLPDWPRNDFSIWKAAAEELYRQNPNWTGMGKLTADVRLAIDFLVTIPEADPERIGTAGHSLGGKMSFYAGCLDPRVKVVMASDFGFRWEDTNWDAKWYWGPEKIRMFKQTGINHCSLLALHAPGLFILVGGEADNDMTNELLNQTERIFKLYTDSPRIRFINHRSGHQPTFPAMKTAWKIMADEFQWDVTDENLAPIQQEKPIESAP